MTREELIDVSTEVFHLLQRHAPAYISLASEKPGPTQKILLAQGVYEEFIDRAIAHRQTLDQVVSDAWARSVRQMSAASNLASTPKRMKKAN